MLSSHEARSLSSDNVDICCLFEFTAVLALEADGAAPLQVFLNDLAAQDAEFFHSDIHVFFAAAEQDQKWFELFRRRAQLNGPVFGHIQGFVDFIHAVGIFRNQLPQLQAAEGHVAGLILGAEAKDRLFRFVLGNHLAHAE